MRKRVNDARVARLATVGASGVPHLVPITYALDGDTLYSAVDHKPKRTTRLQRLINIQRNHGVAVLVDEYDDDWTLLWWCRLYGRARIVHQGPEFDRGIDVLYAKYEQYRHQEPMGPVIRIDINEWSGWTAT